MQLPVKIWTVCSEQDAVSARWIHLKAKMVIGSHLKDKVVRDNNSYQVRTLCLAS